MASDKRSAIREEDVQGLKYFRKLWPLLERLHEVGCQRDKAGNRALFMDQYCSLVLLFLFNPCVRSLRALQQASELKNVQRKLGCGRASLGSLSEATDVFDPERLRQIIGELAAEVKPSRDRSDDLVKHVVTAVDGSVVQTLSTIAEAAYLKTKNGDSRSAWRLHTHFEVDRGVPTRIDVTSGKNGGKNDEKNVLRAHLEADHCYLMDRWYAQFTLFNEIHKLGSSYVCRVRDNSRYEVVQERPPLRGGPRGRRPLRRGRDARCDELARRPARSSRPAGAGRLHAAPKDRRTQGRNGRAAQRRRLADRYESARSAGRDHRRAISRAVDDRDLLSLLQARAGLPPFTQHGARRD